MSGAAVVGIESGNAVQCSRRILSALRGDSLKTLIRELTRAARVCQRAAASGIVSSSLAAEQAELLGAIVGSMRASISGHRPSVETEVSLLGHLARG